MERYNTDKPHRCPKCHTIPISEPDDRPLFNRRDRLEEWVSQFTRELSYRNPIRGLLGKFWRLINPTYAVTKLTLASVTCCGCGTEFTRWPTLPVLKHRGVICAEHTQTKGNSWTTSH